MKNKRLVVYLACLLTLALVACHRAVPLPQAYFRIDLMPKQYTLTDSLKPYRFAYPSNVAHIVPDRKDSLWFDIVYPQYKARVYCSYVPIHNNLYAVSEDTRSFVYKHAIKADAISGRPFENADKQVYGILYEIKGNTASSVQFVLTDSVRHLLRGALYFNNRPNKDSLAPVINYIKEDIVYLMETTQWN